MKNKTYNIVIGIIILLLSIHGILLVKENGELRKQLIDCQLNDINNKLNKP